MRIGFVAEPYEETNASGMGFVVSELLRELLRQGNAHDFVAYSSKRIRQEFISGTYRYVQLPRGFVNKMRWFYRMPQEVDVLLFIAPLLPLVLPRSIRPIMICQELGSQKIAPGTLKEKLFAFVRDQVFMRLSLRRAALVVAASEATRQDLLHFYRLDPTKVVVVYDGYQDLSRYASEAKPVDTSIKPYFFFAGKVKHRKNVHGIAKAFVEFKKCTRAPAHLVIAGDYGGQYYHDIERVLRAGGVWDSTHFVGYTSGPALYSYFKEALAVTFPSINEGFGMPIIEAMSLGTPVITSKISSMAEAAGSAAILVDPHNTSDIAAAMERVWESESLRAELREKGLERAKNFSWPKAAREILTLVEHA